MLTSTNFQRHAPAVGNTAPRRLAMEPLETRAMLAAFDVLVFSKTAAFQHGSIPEGIAAIQALGDLHDFSVVATENAAAFAPANLATFEAVVFLNTTGNVLNATQQAAFEQYIQRGGGWVGVHAAADTEYDWAWYGGLLGAYFQSHPAIQQAAIGVEDDSHPSTAHLPTQWIRTDEWYNFQTNPRGDVNVLLTLDESSYTGGADGADHPIAWYHNYDGGRAWYTGLGHTDASYAEPLFRQHLLGGIQYAAGQGSTDVSADFDADGDVDGADFLRWQGGVGIPSGAARDDGDANLDGRVDAVDLAAWSTSFGGGISPVTSGMLRYGPREAAMDSFDIGGLTASRTAGFAVDPTWIELAGARVSSGAIAVHATDLALIERDLAYSPSRPFTKITSLAPPHNTANGQGNTFSDPRPHFRGLIDGAEQPVDAFEIDGVALEFEPTMESRPT